MGTPGNSYGTGEFNSSGSHSVDHVAGVSSEPGIGNRADNFGGRLSILCRHFDQKVLCHVEFQSFIGSAKDFHDPAHIHLLVRLDRERKVRSIIRKMQRRSQGVQYNIFPLLEILAVTVGAVVGLPEDKVAFAVPESIFLGHGLYIVGSHEIVFVAAVDLSDPGNVGRDCNLIVRYPLSHPDRTLLSTAATKDLEEPGLFLVDYGDTLSAVGIAVLLGKFAHHAHSVAGVVAALEGYPLKFLDEEHAAAVAQGVRT